MGGNTSFCRRTKKQTDEFMDSETIMRYSGMLCSKGGMIGRYSASIREFWCINEQMGYVFSPDDCKILNVKI